VTLDGGRTWRRVARVPGLPASGFAPLGEAGIDRAAGDTVWLGRDGRLVASGDGGRTWRVVHAPWAQAAAQGAAFVGKTGCAGPTVRSAFWRTADGGVTWRPAGTAPFTPVWKCLANLEHTRLAAALARVGAQTAALTGPASAWVVAMPPVGPWSLLRTVDGGRRWLSIRWPADLGDLANASLGALSARIVWIKLETDATYLSTDGGLRWREVAPRAAK